MKKNEQTIFVELTPEMTLQDLCSALHAHMRNIGADHAAFEISGGSSDGQRATLAFVVELRRISG